jgi:signal transduction histidine kinase
LTLENKNLELEKEKVENDLKLQKKNNESNIFLFSGIGSIVVLLLIFAYHKNAHRKNKIIAEQRIKQLEEEKKLLAARSIVVGQEQERKRIAKELHDGLGVLLSTAKMQFTTIKDKSPENKPLIEKARKLLEQAAGDVRKISHNMMPGLLTRYGFYEAVEDLFEKLDDTPGLSARAAISGEQERLPENTEIMLYRIVQEMANNTLKHAGATEVLIDIVKLPTQLSIDYSDNGKGFDVEQMMVNESIGLSSIQSRVNFLNGNFDMQSKPGKGINYHITIPIEDGKEKEV